MRTCAAIAVVSVLWVTAASAYRGSDGRVPTITLGCTGDCDGDRRVTIDEVLHGVSRAEATQEACFGYAQPLRIDQLIKAVSNALNGCP